jgi:hypothetical protein
MLMQPIEQDRPISVADARMGSVFLATFFYTLVAGLMIQLVVLPYLLPHLHGGHGLLKGVDSSGFHEIASAIADRVWAKGWREWEMRPNSHSPAGIAAALYAITGIREPWVMVPVNAALFAISATMIFNIVRLMTANILASVAAALPFVMFPSAALEYADLHKDVWSCAGSLIIVFVLARIQAADELTIRDIAVLAIVCLVGAVLVWTARAYLVRVLLYASVISVALVVLMEALVRRFRFDLALVKKFGAFLLVLGMLVAITRIPTEDSTRGMAESQPPPVVQQQASGGAISSAKPWASDPVQSGPGVVANAVRSIMALRRGFLTTYPEAGSLIDENEVFATAKDVLSYLPRALQVGFFAPFPSTWFAVGVSPGADVMRALTGLEMAVSYVLLFGVLLLVPFAGGRTWRVGALVLSVCLLVIGLMVMAIPIVGTLYRMRYGYFMLPVGLGMAGWVLVAGAVWTRVQRLRATRAVV